MKYRKRYLNDGTSDQVRDSLDAAQKAAQADANLSTDVTMTWDEVGGRWFSKNPEGYTISVI